MAEPLSIRDELGDAVSRAVAIAGPEVLQQPSRLRAIVTDLVGRPGADHRAGIDALVAVADALAADQEPQQGAPDVAPDGGVVTDVRERGVDEDSARWALSVLRGPVDGPRRPPPSATGLSRVTPRLTVAGLLLVAVPLAFFVLDRLSSDDSDPDSDPGTTESSSEEQQTSTASDSEPAEASGFRVDFESATEGVFEVSRTWEIHDGQVTGTVTLTGTTSGLAQHRELVPAEAFTDPVFTPEPDTRTGDVAVFNVNEADAGLSITFEADLTGADPDEATVQGWVDAWQERVGDLRPLDAGPVANASVTPA